MSFLYLPGQGVFDSMDRIRSGIFSGMYAGMIVNDEFSPKLIGFTDTPRFHIGQSYEDKPAKAIFCIRCGRNRFNVAQGDFYTAIRCSYCEWELCIQG